MKKQLVLLVLAIFAVTFSLSAQGFQRRTVEERVKSVHEKLDSAFKPDAAKMASIDAVFTAYYTAQDKIRDENSGDRDAMRAKMTDEATARDEKLKKIFTEAEMKTWKESIEPSMRPQRGNRPPGGGGQ